MGCTASRSANFVSDQQDPTPDSSSSFSDYRLHRSFSDPPSRTFPLVHHPPLRKGDSNHFVCLTSTTYGSLVLVDPPNPSPKPQEFRDPEDPLSPDSVINTWELMEGLDEEEFQFHYQIVDDPSESLESYEIVELPLSRESSGAENKIVLYYTSLRGIRKTYEDCCSVRVILRGFRVCVDERDISMDRSYRRELQEALEGKAMGLPQVFISGKHIGGAEEIRQLNETGELGKLLQGFPVIDLGFVCKNCGDARFVLCPNCSGSRKVYEEEEGSLRKCCPDCNENGLVRCSGCCP